MITKWQFVQTCHHKRRTQWHPLCPSPTTSAGLLSHMSGAQIKHMQLCTALHVSLQRTAATAQSGRSIHCGLSLHVQSPALSTCCAAALLDLVPYCTDHPPLPTLMSHTDGHAHACAVQLVSGPFAVCTPLAFQLFSTCSASALLTGSCFVGGVLHCIHTPATSPSVSCSM
jgi:hypothetical protein